MLPSTCTRAIAAGCDDIDLQPVLLFMRHEPKMICAKCRAVLEASGAAFTLVERRAEDRPFRPAWLANLRARDETAA